MKNCYISGLVRVNYTDNIYKVDLLTVLNSIKDGTMKLNDFEGNASTLAEVIHKIREVYPKDQMRTYKQALLPAVDFNGVFGNGMVLEQYNTITAIDIDHIGGRDKLEAMRQKLIADPHSVAVFETPSGDGLKVIVQHDNLDPRLHTQMYQQIMTYYDCHDEKCTDIKRRHYLSYDPNLWINPGDAESFHFEPMKEMPRANVPLPKTHSTTRPYNNNGNGKRKSDNSIIAILNASWRREHPEYWQEGHRATGIFECARFFCKVGVDEGKALNYFIDNWRGTGLDDEEIIHNCQGGYKYVRDKGEEMSIIWK